MTEANEPNVPKQLPPPPYALALIVCDGIHADPGTGKKTLLGIFTNFQARQFPARIPQMCVYIALSDGRGKVPIKVAIVRVPAHGEEQEIAAMEADVEFPDPLAVIDLIIVIGNPEFPEPGEYRVQLYACNEFVIERKLVVIQIPMPPEAK